MKKNFSKQLGILSFICGLLMTFIGIQSVKALAPTPEACFTFNINKQEIQSYTVSANCPSDVVIPETIGGIAVKVIGGNSFKEKGLTSVVIPNNVTSVDSNAFKGNGLLQGSVTVENIYLGVTFAKNVFADNPSKGLTITPVFLYNSFTPASCFVFDTTTRTITGFNGVTQNHCIDVVKVPPKIDGLPVEAIGDYAFANKQLKGVNLPLSVTLIGEGAFKNNLIEEYRATSLNSEINVSVGIDAFANNGINGATDVDITFLGEYTSQDCFYHKSFFAGYNGLGTATVSYINRPYCPTDVNIPPVVNNFIIIGIDTQGFYQKNITSVVIPNTVESIGNNAFTGNALTSVYLPDSIASIGMGAFSNNSLTSVKLSSNLKTISYTAFQSNLLTNIVIPDGVINIADGAFNLNSLIDLTIPNSVTNIGMLAFGYNNLTNVTLGNNVNSIGPKAFYSNQLTNIFIPNSVNVINESAFRYNNILQGNAIIDNSVSNVSLGISVFDNNGINMDTTITPVFLR